MEFKKINNKEKELYADNEQKYCPACNQYTKPNEINTKFCGRCGRAYDRRLEITSNLIVFKENDKSKLVFMTN